MTDINKKMHKRWGKAFIDRRAWRLYNEQLVKRGEFLLDLDMIQDWDGELVLMNAKKVGRPFRFPNSLIQIQALWHAKQIPLRMIEGITRKLCRYSLLPDFNDYTTVDRRIMKLDYELEPPNGDCIRIFSDGSGIQATSGGEYLREKYGKKNRRWVQIVLLGNPDTKEPVSYEVNLIQESEAESTQRQTVDLLRRGMTIVSAGGDGAMDSIDLWTFLEEQGIEPIIKPDKNARIDSESSRRNNFVKKIRRTGFHNWSRDNHYGGRWPATEGIFSAIKRIFGEQIWARSEKGMLKETAAKVWAYQRMKRYGERV
jgi:hypothetical protein